ncbi:5-dehydro-4-deoxyglucarate dehydratase [Sinobaca sp. H24]|uniref:5-dehydro-4-deoxyglucarate dehydratase n=1 Tax=Sinobaca sp. H24 TaxID=2923376 RepID=UPI00207A944B|nr:5-dehydro-4-deoxyglucarate dehydratase [Sinobaca sp. H24]
MEQRQNLPKGILGFPTAPFKNDGGIDEKALEENIKYLIKEDLSAIFIACGSGEFQSLSAKEYQNMVDIAVSVTNKQVPVYTGVGGNIQEALNQTVISEKAGADGYLILPPYLIQGEQEGIYEYYRSIIENTNLNSIIYQRDNAISDLNTVTKLAELPQLIGLKDGHGNMELNIELIQHLGDRFEWMNGMPFAEITMPAYYHMGFETYSSAMSNYIPHISRMYFEALKKNDKETLHNLYQDVLLPINDIRKKKKGYAVSLIKAGMEIMGFNVGQSVRAPVVEVSKEHYKELEGIVKRALDKYPEPSVKK